MSESDPARIGRRSKVILLGLSMVAILVALVVMYMAFNALLDADIDEATQRYIAALALIAGSLLIVALFCMGILLLRYLAYGVLMRRGPQRPTRYVNAWDLAGQRAGVPDEDELEEMMGDDDDDEEDSDLE